MCNFLSDTTFISSLAGAGFGAGLAFWLGAKREENKKRQEDIGYIIYSLNILCQINGCLYGLKKIFLSKKEDMDYVTEGINVSQTQNKAVRLATPLKDLGNAIQCAPVNFAINIERLNFTSDLNVGISSLLYTAEESIKTHNTILNQLNEHLAQNFHAEKREHSPVILALLLNFTKNWGAEIDRALYLSELLQEVLIEYGKRKYKNDFKIKTIFTGEDCTSLKPPILEDWQRTKENWIEITWVDKYLPIFKKIYKKIMSGGKK